MPGHTFAFHLVAAARTLVFEKTTEPKQFREPESIIFADTSGADITVSVEWYRFVDGATFFVSKNKVVQATDTGKADLSHIVLRDGDKLYATSSGTAECFVYMQETEEKRSLLR